MLSMKANIKIDSPTTLWDLSTVVSEHYLQKRRQSTCFSFVHFTQTKSLAGISMAQTRTHNFNRKRKRKAYTSRNDFIFPIVFYIRQPALAGLYWKHTTFYYYRISSSSDVITPNIYVPLLHDFYHNHISFPTGETETGW